MWCGVKYTYGHTCVKSQLYQMLVEEADDNSPEGEVFADCVETLEDNKDGKEEDQQPVISLHGIFGTGDSHTMRLQGKIKNTQLVILVDFGSTHSFIDYSVAKRVGCTAHALSGLGVTITNGDKVWVQAICKDVFWESEDLKQTTDFMVLPMRGCNLVLGVQWFRELGSIVWDFNALTMQFTL